MEHVVFQEPTFVTACLAEWVILIKDVQLKKKEDIFEPFADPTMSLVETSLALTFYLISPGDVFNLP